MCFFFVITMNNKFSRVNNSKNYIILKTALNEQSFAITARLGKYLFSKAIALFLNNQDLKMWNGVAVALETPA